MNPQRKARRVALQALYEIDSSAHAPGDVVLQRLEWEATANTPLGTSAHQLLSRLVSGVIEHRVRLDDLIEQFAPEWPLDQMAFVDRNVLRMAIFEIVASHDTPLKVAINEAVELAKFYGSDNAPRFVNGVLGTIAGRKAELIAQFEATIANEQSQDTAQDRD